MKELSRAQELRITGAAERMVDLTNGGMSPNDALYKVSMDESLTPEFVKRLGEVYNTSRMLHHFKTASAERRADNFPLAVSAEVLDRMYPKEAESHEKAASCHSIWFDAPPNFRDVPFEKSAERTAIPALPSYSDNLDVLLKRARNHAASLERAAQVARSDEQYCREMVRNEVVKASQYFCSMDHIPFERVETDVLTQYGSTASPLLDAVFVGCRGEKFGEKRGSASDSQRIFDHEQPPYSCIVNAFRAATEWHKAAMEAQSLEREHAEFKERLAQTLKKVAKLREPHLTFPFDDIAARAAANREKQASGLAPLASLSIIGDKLHNIMGTGGNPEAFEQRVQQSLDPDQETKIRSAQVKAMLHEMMTNDPVLSGYDPTQVMDAYNEISRMTPLVAEQPALMRGLLARRLELGSTEPFEASQTIDAETGLKRIAGPA